MRRFFVYDGVADVPLHDDGYVAKASGYVEGAKLMFGAMDRGDIVMPMAFGDETTRNDKIYGTIWEVSDETYVWLIEELYGDYALARDLKFIDKEGNTLRCDTMYLANGVFAIPEEDKVAVLKSYYDYYDLDTAYVDKAVEESEHEVYGMGNA